MELGMPVSCCGEISGSTCLPETPRPLANSSNGMPNIHARLAARDSGKSGCSSPENHLLVDDSLIPQARAKSFARYPRCLSASRTHSKVPDMCSPQLFCASRAKTYRSLLNPTSGAGHLAITEQLFSLSWMTFKGATNDDSSLSFRIGGVGINGHLSPVFVQLLRHRNFPVRENWPSRDDTQGRFGGPHP
ncbi:hypothetical protein [Caudoviricetes sp.]|nr:hypothetical protein [Caudoviricetes sp.]